MMLIIIIHTIDQSHLKMEESDPDQPVPPDPASAEPPASKVRHMLLESFFIIMSLCFIICHFFETLLDLLFFDFFFNIYVLLVYRL